MIVKVKDIRRIVINRDVRKIAKMIAERKLENARLRHSGVEYRWGIQTNHICNHNRKNCPKITVKNSDNHKPIITD